VVHSPGHLEVQGMQLLNANNPAQEQAGVITKKNNDLPFKLPSAWRLIAQGAGLSMETNIHTLGDYIPHYKLFVKSFSKMVALRLAKIRDSAVPNHKGQNGWGSHGRSLTLRRQYGYTITSPDSSLNPGKRRTTTGISYLDTRQKFWKCLCNCMSIVRLKFPSTRKRTFGAIDTHASKSAYVCYLLLCGITC